MYDRLMHFFLSIAKQELILTGYFYCCNQIERSLQSCCETEKPTSTRVGQV